MSKDLTSMIDEINNASAAINKTSKPDDPVSTTPHLHEDDRLMI